MAGIAGRGVVGAVALATGIAAGHLIGVVSGIVDAPSEGEAAVRVAFTGLLIVLPCIAYAVVAAIRRTRGQDRSLTSTARVR